MKIILNVIFKIYILIPLLTVNSACQAQLIMQTVSDAKKLELNEKLFVEKPLITLLKAKIQRAIGVPGDVERPSFFIFYFVPNKEYNQYKSHNKIPLAIKVYIKGSFEWDTKDKAPNDYLSWTKVDEKKYGNLIVGAIRVYGEN